MEKRKKVLLQNNQWKEGGEDRLSELPDSLILYILSLIQSHRYSKLKQVIRTCVLSKRWQFLWTNMSEIDLCEDDMDEVGNFVNYVGKVLDMCSANHLHKFSVEFPYEDDFDPYLNNWIQTAVERNVKDISLIRYYNRRFYGDDYYELYELSPMLYSHSSLTSLTLKLCDMMTPRETVKWQSLKSLSLSHVKLCDSLMEKILSGCPVLEDLRLKKCCGFTCLNIFSPTFTKLEIKLSANKHHTIDISAPYARELKIEYSAKECACEFEQDDMITQFRLRDITSLLRASLDFNIGLSVPKIYMNELLQSLQYVKELDLRGFCIEDLYDEEIIELVENIDLVFNHLKTINIKCRDDESMMILAQILLKSANVLQKMDLSYDNPWGNSFEELSKTLLALPRTSPQAIVTTVKI